ncbi:MAG: glutathione synthase [Pseudomonadota bacterium]
MTIKIGVVMDPIERIKPAKDSTLAMLLAAQKRDWALHYMLPQDLYLRDGTACAQHRALRVADSESDWYSFGASHDGPLSDLDVVLMRVDPPFDMDYIYATYILERAESAGVLVVNKPQSLRDANEKLFTAWFPDLCPTTLVSASQARLKSFVEEQQDAVIKPLDGMGGESIFRLGATDPNLNVILEHMTRRGTRQCMIQSYLPEIVDGDKRILLVDGTPAPFALARIPSAGETRGNLAAGGRGVPVPLSDDDRRIAEAVAQPLRERGLVFVGLDVIGDRLTEINVTSPTCIRELDKGCGLDIAGDLMEAIDTMLAAR